MKININQDRIMSPFLCYYFSNTIPASSAEKVENVPRHVVTTSFLQPLVWRLKVKTSVICMLSDIVATVYSLVGK